MLVFKIFRSSILLIGIALAGPFGPLGPANGYNPYSLLLVGETFVGPEISTDKTN